MAKGGEKNLIGGIVIYTNGDTSKKNTAGTVQTGDVSNVGMWTFLTMLSGIAVILVKRKVKDK